MPAREPWSTSTACMACALTWWFIGSRSETPDCEKMFGKLGYGTLNTYRLATHPPRKHSGRDSGIGPTVAVCFANAGADNSTLTA